MANRGCIVLLGDFSNERPDLASIGRDFCWSVAQASDVTELKEICSSCTVMAVMVQAAGLEMQWPGALGIVRAAAPLAKIILCHKAEDSHARAEMIEAGAFAVLLSPLAHSEVRQSLGFVWASARKPVLLPAAIPRAGVA